MALTPKELKIIKVLFLWSVQSEPQNDDFADKEVSQERVLIER